MGNFEGNKNSEEGKPSMKPRNGDSRKDIATGKNTECLQEDPCLTLEELIHESDSKTLKALLATAEPGASSWEMADFAADKWYYILEGKLEIVVNNASFILAEGDSIYLKSTGSHIWRNPTNEKARALVLTSPAWPHED